MTKNFHAIALGKLGGRARAKKLTKKRRREIAKNAVLARIRKGNKHLSGKIVLDNI